MSYLIRISKSRWELSSAQYVSGAVVFLEGQSYDVKTSPESEPPPSVEAGGFPGGAWGFGGRQLANLKSPDKR